MRRKLIPLLLLAPVISFCQISLDHVDASAQALKNIDIIKSVELAKRVLNELLKNGKNETIAAACKLAITIAGVPYSTREELGTFFNNAIKATGNSKANPKISNVFVLGRRKELLNGFINIDFLYIVGIIQFSIDGQNPEKAVLFAMKNPVSPSIVGMHIE